MSPGDDLASRKAQLVAQCDLDRMRLAHALLVTRQAASPFHGGGVRAFAWRLLGFALPLFAAARSHGVVRTASLLLAVVRAVRRLFSRRK